METKSRYEIIAELEQKKAELLQAKANAGLNEIHLKQTVQQAEDKLKSFQENKVIVLQNLDDQLESINKSLERFDSQKKQ